MLGSRRCCLSLVLIGAVALAGCELFDRDDDRDRDRVRGSDRIGRVSDTGVPATAERVGEGRGELSYRAREDGTMYLYSADSRVLLDRQRMRRGQRYTIDPSRDLATLDGKPVWERDMDPKHTHRLYFDRDRGR